VCGPALALQFARKAGRVRLVNYGCGFATTGSMIKGNRACLPARDPGYRNVSPKTSQLAAAERFLKARRGKPGFVTIDIGANDVASCGAGGQIDLACVSKGVAAIGRNAPKIAKRLRAAAGKGTPGTRLQGRRRREGVQELRTVPDRRRLDRHATSPPPSGKRSARRRANPPPGYTRRSRGCSSAG
jgi:hypothetical protein